MRRPYGPAACDDSADAGNYWRTTVPAPACPPAESHATDVAIVGAGVTGLSVALHLARDHGAAVTVLDAGQPGQGASGRAGGFVCLGGAKASDDTLARRHGEEEAALWRRTQHAAIDLVAATLDRHAIEADTHSEGETLLAHTPRRMAALRAAAGASPGARLFERDALADHGLGSPAFHGALTVPAGFALNPLKYTLGLARAAAAAGATIAGGSPVTGIARMAGRYVLTTPTARIEACALILATNGYSSDDLPAWMAARYLPAQSAILVTRPLTRAELAAQGWTSAQMCYDTRSLLHYFRLLPERRMLFGMRGGIGSGPRARAAMRRRVRRDFDATFPAWRGVETPHFWTGFVCLSARRTPYAGPLGDWPDAWAGFAYHGNGLAMGSYLGALLADRAAGAPPRPAPGFLAEPPRRFPLGRHRRWLLAPLYTALALADRF